MRMVFLYFDNCCPLRLVEILFQLLLRAVILLGEVLPGSDFCRVSNDQRL